MPEFDDKKVQCYLKKKKKVYFSYLNVVVLKREGEGVTVRARVREAFHLLVHSSKCLQKLLGSAV